MSGEPEKPIMYCPGCLKTEHIVAYNNRIQCKDPNCQAAATIGWWNYMHKVSNSKDRLAEAKKQDEPKPRKKKKAEDAAS